MPPDQPGPEQEMGMAVYITIGRLPLALTVRLHQCLYLMNLPLGSKPVEVAEPVVAHIIMAMVLVDFLAVAPEEPKILVPRMEELAAAVVVATTVPAAMSAMAVPELFIFASILTRRKGGPT